MYGPGGGGGCEPWLKGFDWGEGGAKSGGGGILVKQLELLQAELSECANLDAQAQAGPYTSLSVYFQLSASI